LEIIIVDNDSMDGTPEILERYPLVIAHEQRRGAAAARNRGATLAQGEILAFTDADCVVDKRWAREIEQAFQDEGVQVLMGFAHGINATLFAELEQKRWEESWLRKSETGYSLKRKGIDTRNCAMRKPVLEKCGYFNPELLGCEDWELSIRINREGYPIAFNPRMKVWHKNPTTFQASLEKGRKRMPIIVSLLGSLPPGVQDEDVPFPSSAFFGMARRNIHGFALSCVLLVLRLACLPLKAGFLLGLTMGARHPTFKLYKVFLGLSYDIAILSSRRRDRG
jgi:glycosyltransferase involved in cell wall biosynthesis